jgi:hypothetical protein
MKGSGKIQIIFSEEIGFKKNDIILTDNKREFKIVKVYRMNWWRNFLCIFSNRFYTENKAILKEVKTKS